MQLVQQEQFAYTLEKKKMNKVTERVTFEVALFIFGLCIIAYVGMTFNIGNAVLYGLIVYTILKMIFEKKKPVSHWWLMLIFAAINLILDFVV